jgi:drug/metabolite transporter (DMT)-like permease
MGLTLGNVLLTTMILGLNPVVISWYEYYKQRDQYLQLRGLVPPSLLIIFGLLMTHIAIFDEPISISAHILGCVFGGLALATWAWFIVSNATFLKRHPKIPIHDWVTVLGIATLFWGVVALLSSQLFNFILGKDSFSFGLGGSMTSYLLGSLALGVGSSWGAQYLWNHATQRLPLVLTGLLGIFETLFGLLFFYLLEGTLPTPVISFGIATIFLGIVMAICNSQKTILLANET